MKNVLLFLISLSSCAITIAQVKYGTPTTEPLPEKFDGLRQSIIVNNFPKEINAIELDGEYYWMHNTSILCLESDIAITEFGAYLFYNDTWNLRKSYPLKDLDKFFNTKRHIMRQAQPYTWTNNWRVDKSLYGGWSMWYFIGTTKDGETVCGFQKIFTSSNLLKS